MGGEGREEKGKIKKEWHREISFASSDVLHPQLLIDVC